MKPITEVRCSKLARPMVCAGFLSFENLFEEEAGEPAKEGTAAGEMLAHNLLGRAVRPGMQASNGVYFNEEMQFYTSAIANEIRAKAQTQILCEQRIDWQTRSGIWIRGSYDVSFVHEGRLYIDDLKYGYGIIEVFECWQLLGYAIGEVIRRQSAYEEIVLRIRQPRPHHEDGDCREWRMSYAELLGYKERIEKRMDEIANGFKQLQTSKSCKYCAAAAEACPAFSRMYYRGLEVATEFVQDSLTDKEVSRQLDEVNRFTEILKIKKDSITALAISRIGGGKIIPGYLTEPKLGDRTWKAGVTPKALETLTGRKVTEDVLLSPAKVEKLGVHKNFIAQLVDRRHIGQSLVRKDASKIGDKIFGTGAPNGPK